MNLSTVSQRRTAASLLELLAAMSAASIVTAAAAGLVHKSFSLESRSRSTVAEERTALRLARQFRADIHTGLSATCSADPAEETTTEIVMIAGPAGSVVYRREETGLVRIETAVAGGLTREDFVFSPSVSWAARKHGRLVTLQGSAAATSTPSTNPQRPRPAITISAALPAAPAVPLPTGDTP